MVLLLDDLGLDLLDDRDHERVVGLESVHGADRALRRLEVAVEDRLSRRARQEWSAESEDAGPDDLYSDRDLVCGGQ